MKNKSLVALAITASLTLTACQTTQITQATVAPSVEVINQANPNQTAEKNITLEQAMAHPDWIARSAERSYWAADSSSVFYAQKQAGSELRDIFHQPISGEQAHLVSDEKRHQIGSRSAVFNQDKSLQAYVFKGNVFVNNIKKSTLTQLTRSNERASDLQFLTTGELVYRQGNGFFAVNLTSGFTQQLAQLNLADEPKGVTEPTSYIAKEQHKLIDFVALTHKNKKQRAEQDKQLLDANSSVFTNQFYLGKGQELVSASLSPNGQQMIVVIKAKSSWRDDSDIMPNYITQDAGIESVPARRRVADEKSSGSTVLMLDLDKKTQTALTFDTLPGFDEDVLASVKSENYARDGKTYKSERKARDINLMMDWGWSQTAIQWNAAGDQVALMLEAWDNKDRWIATVDFENARFVSQHRLHDTAWVNYTYNDYGWLADNSTLYFLSEESGYSHIYTKQLNGKPQQHTQGQFVVSNLTLDTKNNRLIYKANKKHPGIYEVYQLDLANKTSTALTELNGMTDYQLSPDSQKLLLTHSKLVSPPELFVANAEPNAPLTQLTDTVTEQFKQTQLIAPKIVAVPSSHTSQPIYAKVYYPADYVPGEQGKNRKAVIFNHGAGYLQNSHLGWSGYFREFMFHSLLASEGYVVMDMDYRASKGYGRDWRTAIYRHMGKPEIEDLADGITWMVDNVNVNKDAVGTYGGSYGGFMTFMALMTRPELFQAGAALRPVSDWAHYNAPYTSNILNHPDVDPIAYERSSPIYFAQGLEDPLLINAPMVDDNVFFQDVVRLVQRFIELEKEDFETAIYPVEPHGFRQPSGWLDEYRRIYKLFKENL
ncbi:S9 family peptidase [Pseudoalteromonas ulvae]|uniref:S9 family peptidase n=1 Tax=Pseudoalteromonas ulvae TaxID=107327 RepID=A0A244CMA8_PSEDV|nr:prolyl oligopeptidase family serine peptidase [Pseudoalteromonas ulvae]OUL56771.1 S9 family peptidase [Pseudoalteromonas ulvae]